MLGLRLNMLARAALVATAISIPSATADTIFLDGFPYKDLTVTGYQDGAVTAVWASQRKLYPLKDVDKIELDGKIAFNDAETARVQKDWNKAAEMYVRAISSSSRGVKQAVEARAITAFDQTGKYLDAVTAFLDIYAASPTAATYELRPRKLPDASSRMLTQAATNISAHLADKPFDTPEAQKNLKSMLLDIYTQARDPRAGAVARELGAAAPAKLAETPAAAAGGAGEPGELFPSASVATGNQSDDSAILHAPLLSPQDQQDFQRDFGDVIQAAHAGSDDDRHAAEQLLLDKATNAGVPMRRHMLMEAFGLIKDVHGTAEEQATIAELLVNLDDGSSIAVAKLNAQTYIDMIGRLGQNRPPFTPDKTAQAYLRLADLNLRANDFSAADAAAQEAETWAKKDAVFLASAQPSLAAFKKRLADSQKRLSDAQELAGTIKKNPDDPSANRKIGMSLLAKSTPEQAAPYLAKSGVTQLQRIAAVLQGHQTDVKSLLDLAAASVDALDIGDTDERNTLVALAYHQLQLVPADRSATEGEKNRAEMISLKMEAIVAKTGTASPAGSRVVYIVQHSGSVLDNFDFTREYLKRSVDGLIPPQQFAVIGFAGDVDSDNPTSLQRPTQEVREALGKRLNDIKAQGEADDMLPPFQHAFEKAFNLKPNVIYFLTDGAFDPKLLGVVKRLNADHGVKINTLNFVQEDPRYAQQLRDLAKENGGTYKFVSGADLRRAP